MSIYPDLPFDQAGGHGGDRTLTQMVVIHATDNTASDEAEAHYAETRPDHTSAHFYADADSVIQALNTDLVAYGCYPIGNSRSVQFELTGTDWPGAGQITDAAMRQVAPIVARVCAQYGIPVRKIGPAELHAGVRGICGHADVTLAWGQGDHMDPGPAFPWARFLAYVGGTEMIDYSQQVPDGPARAGNPGRTIGQWVGDLWSQTFGVPSQIAGLSAKLDALGAAFHTLATAGTSVDTAAVLAAVQQVGDAESQAVADLKTQVADLTARLAAAGRALDTPA